MAALNIVLVDNISALHNCLSAIYLPEPPIHVAVDLEGINLCRDGRLCIIQLFAKDSDTIWLIDITTLGGVAFDDVDDQGRTLRGLLEDPAITKYMYDVRNDSDALYNPHRVRLANVYDLQLLELATRATQNESTRYVNGLKKSIGQHLIIPKEWARVKDAGCALFAPELGGRYEVFEQRPLDPRIIAYCAQDVTLLFQLEAALKRKIGQRALGSWENRIVRESAERVKVAYDPSYQPNGRHKALAPFGWRA